MRYALLLALVGSALASDGIDAIQAISTAGFQCLKNNGYSFFVARVWESVGNYDYTGIQNIKNARAAGWEYVDGYIFPCVSSRCAAPANQIQATVNKLHAEGAKFGMLWLDIEKLAWSGNVQENRNFIAAMANELTAMGINWGIYTSASQWGPITGNWNAYGNKPLWWADYNGRKDYSGFQSFGGWSKPSIHQWAGDVKIVCGIDADLSWY